MPVSLGKTSGSLAVWVEFNLMVRNREETLYQRKGQQNTLQESELATAELDPIWHFDSHLWFWV